MNKPETQLQQQLTRLRTRLLIMCAAVGIALDEACESLRTDNMGRAAAVIDGDTAIDALENEIDDMSLSILARSQPVAQDLRFVVGALRMVGDLERIGDEAADIAERALTSQGLPDLPAKNAILELMGKVSALYREALEAFRDADCDRAGKIYLAEDEILQAEVSILQRMLREYRVSGDLPYTIMHGILICRALNRIARRSINIAEHVLFIVRGENVKHKPHNRAAKAENA